MNITWKDNEISFVNLLVLTIAGLVNAFGVTVFLAPVKLYDSGISGTSMLLGQITPEYLSLSLFLNSIQLDLTVIFYRYVCSSIEDH